MKIFSLATLLGIFILSSTRPVFGNDHVIENGKTVKFEYTLYVNGDVADTSEGKEPLQYKHGDNMIIKGLERQLTGLKVGDEKKVVVGADEAYGQVDPQAFVEVPKTNLGDDIEPKVGMILQVQGQGGQVMSALVHELKEESVILNFNHPLAGEELTFEIKVVSIE